MVNSKIRKDFFKFLISISSILIGGLVLSYLKMFYLSITPLMFFCSVIIFFGICFFGLFLVINKIKSKTANKNLKKHYSKFEINFFDNVLYNLTSIAQIFVYNKILKNILLGFTNLFIIFVAFVIFIFSILFVYLSTFKQCYKNYSSIQNSRMEIACFLSRLCISIPLDLIVLLIFNSSLIPLAIANINLMLIIALVYVIISVSLAAFECYDNLDLGQSLRNVSVDLEICFTIREVVSSGLRKINDALLGVFVVALCAICLNNFFVVCAFFSIMSIFVLYNVSSYLYDVVFMSDMFAQAPQSIAPCALIFYEEDNVNQEQLLNVPEDLVEKRALVY